MRTIGVVSVGRSDYGIYLPILRRIEADKQLRLHLLAGGMHLAPEFGRSVTLIERDGFAVADRIEMLLSSDSPEGIAKSIGLGTIGFAQSYARTRPDILVVLGDRFEMFAAALAALPFRLPIAHIHGGEVTEGAIDDALRHSMTKLSHMHFVATEDAAARVEQLGEEPWRITVSGAPSLDQVEGTARLSDTELAARHGLRVDPAALLVTFHSASLEYELAGQQTASLLEALAASGRPLIFTLPNADTNGRIVIRMIREFVRDRAGVTLVENLGTAAYFTVMSRVAAMVGNSSSGIIEASSFRLPVVNIGSRQRGRLRAGNVIDVGDSAAEILAGIHTAVAPTFRVSLSSLTNPFGDGHAAERIVNRLKDASLDDQLLLKRFHRVPQ